MQPANFSTILGVGPTAGRSLPGTRIGQYEVIRLLGRGGMGEVHLARDLRLGRLVAIKLLTTRQPNLGERFLAEARATAHCHHENIVVIHEVGEHDGTPYMVFEYLEGQTLRQWLVERSETGGGDPDGFAGGSGAEPPVGSCTSTPPAPTPGCRPPSRSS